MTPPPAHDQYSLWAEGPGTLGPPLPFLQDYHAQAENEGKPTLHEKLNPFSPPTASTTCTTGSSSWPPSRTGSNDKAVFVKDERVTFRKWIPGVGMTVMRGTVKKESNTEKNWYYVTVDGFEHRELPKGTDEDNAQIMTVKDREGQYFISGHILQHAPKELHASNSNASAQPWPSKRFDQREVWAHLPTHTQETQASLLGVRASTPPPQPSSSGPPTRRPPQVPQACSAPSGFSVPSGFDDPPPRPVSPPILDERLAEKMRWLQGEVMRLQQAQEQAAARESDRVEQEVQKRLKAGDESARIQELEQQLQAQADQHHSELAQLQETMQKDFDDRVHKEVERRLRGKEIPSGRMAARALKTLVTETETGEPVRRTSW